MPNPLIELRGISKHFFTQEVETRALSEVSLCIEQGEFLALSGPSGCGKSTLLALLGLLDVPTRGSYHLQGRDVAGLSRDQRAAIRNQRIGFVFQSFNLISDLSVEENVALPLSYRPGVSPAERSRRTRQALAQVEMSHRLRHYPSQLSGGQQQRVAIARALIGDPAIILADEPTGNLDSKNADTVLDLLQSLHQQGATICMVTHDASVLSRSSRQAGCSKHRVSLC